MDDIEMLHYRLHNALKVVNSFRNILDSYVIEFYVKDMYHTILPKSWQNNNSPLNNLEYKDFVWLLDNSGTVKDKLPPPNIYPLTLLALRKCSQEFSLSRKYSEHTCSSIFEKIGNENFEYVKVPHIPNEFHRHVSSKKRHELLRISEFVMNINRIVKESSGSNLTVVDVGCGLGHLSRLLSRCFQLPVVSVESNAKLLEKSKELDKSLSRNVQKIDNRTDNSVCLKVGNGGLFEDILGQKDSSYFLVGLHTCGTLSTCLLHEFVENSNFRAILTLSCCYMKNQTCESSTVNYFPLCNSLQYEKPFKYLSLELACHANEQLIDKVKMEENLNFLKVHSYRALLEFLLYLKFPVLYNDENRRLKSVKNAHTLNFFEYCKFALAIESCRKFDDFDDEIVENTLKEWKNILPFIIARLLIAPLLETILLIDRFLFLKEHGYERIYLLPLFDPKISARNLALFCLK